MADREIKLEITGTLDPDYMLFALCLERASHFTCESFTEYASRVETLVEICENMGCQRIVFEKADD